MKQVKHIICLAFCIYVCSVLTASAQFEEKFYFNMTKFGGISKDGTGVAMRQSESEILVIISDFGAKVMAAIDRKLMFESTEVWSINSQGSLTNETATGSILSINAAKGSISIGDAGTTLVFSDPRDKASFKKDYDRLVAFLKNMKRLKGGSSNPAGSASSANGAPSALPKAPSTITPVQAIDKFMGFIPLQKATFDYVSRVARHNGWRGEKVSYSFPNICVWKGNPYTPLGLKLYDGEVSQGSIFYTEGGKIREYFIYLSYPYSRFTHRQALYQITKIKNDLSVAGYAFSTGNQHSSDFPSYVATKNGKTVELDLSAQGDGWGNCYRIAIYVKQ